MTIKLGAKELRDFQPTKEQLAQVKRQPIYFVLDEILDTYNIGSLFRLADAVAAEKVYLCGQMETPPLTKIHEAAVGTEKWVPWEKVGTTLEAVRSLKSQGVHIIAVEQDPRAIWYDQLKPQFPLALVLGNETYGISQEVLNKADTIIQLPMLGVNKSFNVWGSAAVVAYQILELLLAKEIPHR